jgi:hypothetical protein
MLDRRNNNNNNNNNRLFKGFRFSYENRGNQIGFEGGYMGKGISLRQFAES